ncbi:hypothetical protein J1N35_019223 [Gossypium stocksii]|uniref:Uncharacterized protein n=1 Tax=Gossypium stocksii TaxID=47602 RepID=A0A9D3VQH5_9ROSI|nr:hypothetical protein J1N35_019223 [Gossypium stocksii]
MELVLAARGIKLPHFAYEFSIPRGSHQVCETTDDCFLLPLHALETEFHLPLHHFFYRLLNDEVSILVVSQCLKQRKYIRVYSILYEDFRVIAGVGRNQGCDDNLSETDRLLRKLNEDMDIDVLISSGCKKHKTFVGMLYASTLLVRRRRAVPNWSIAKIGSLALANCFGGFSSSLASLDLTIGSFALANYFGGCSSSFMSLDLKTKSFTLTNYFGGCGSLPTSIGLTVGSFALANCFRGCSSSLASLDIIAGSFALANCFEGYDSSSTSLGVIDDSIIIMTFYS